MTRLTDTQLVILSAACARPDGAVYPIASKLTGGALQKVLGSLLGKGLLTEVAAKRDDTVWRLDADEGPLTLAATPSAQQALGLGAVDVGRTGPAEEELADAAAQAATGGGKAGKGKRGATKPTNPAVKPDTGRAGGKGGRKAAGARKGGSAEAAAGTDAKGPRSRDGTKQASLIAMLRRPDGVTVEEAVAAFGWQPHTVRGALYGALKKKLGLDVTSETVEARGRVYRIRD